VIRALQAAARATRTLKGYRADWLAGWLAKMADWAQGWELDPDVLVRFSRATLLAKGWADAERWPVLVDLEALHAHLLVEPAVADAVLSHAAQAVLRAYQRAKARAAQFDFSDLLQNLYHALQAPDGRLAAAIAAQYPVALVDEFQDTDPWQFGALSRIYSCKPNTDMRYRHISNEILADQGFATTGQAALGLIMIGDPKQAIYSFRGADLATYLQAREQAQGIYNATGQLPRHGGAGDGGQPGVCAGRCTLWQRAVCTSQSLQPAGAAIAGGNGLAQVAMTVWHVPLYKRLPAKTFCMTNMAALFATQMVRLLQATAAQPGDMAVLVRDRQRGQRHPRGAVAARRAQCLSVGAQQRVCQRAGR
jgi:exodeoxyribonuclease V beta subunit